MRLNRVILESNCRDAGTCPVCCNGLAGTLVAHLPCGHALRHGCLKRLSHSRCDAREKCPICRATFTAGLPRAEQARLLADRARSEAMRVLDVVGRDEVSDTEFISALETLGLDRPPPSESDEEEEDGAPGGVGWFLDYGADDGPTAVEEAELREFVPSPGQVMLIRAASVAAVMELWGGEVSEGATWHSRLRSVGRGAPRADGEGAPRVGGQGAPMRHPWSLSSL